MWRQLWKVILREVDYSDRQENLIKPMKMRSILLSRVFKPLREQKWLIDAIESSLVLMLAVFIYLSVKPVCSFTAVLASVL
jgi:hypothetical protein